MAQERKPLRPREKNLPRSRAKRLRFATRPMKPRSNCNRPSRTCSFEEFGPAPVEGADLSGNRWRPDHLLRAAQVSIFCSRRSTTSNGTNLTALAQERERGAITSRPSILPRMHSRSVLKMAPTVIEFTDPDCPYCQALDRFWSAEGRRRQARAPAGLIFFVSGIHPSRQPPKLSISFAPQIAKRHFQSSLWQAQTPPRSAQMCDRDTPKLRQDAAACTPKSA
jgi:thiol:disulfide interchange protein DsbC